jgi:putative NADH-flavin reductase
MSKILIFGANGYIGSEITRQAIEQDLEIIAFVRNSDKLTIQSPNLSVFQGDALKFDEVEKAMNAQVTVVSALSALNVEDRILQIRNIIQAMQNTQARRLVVVGGAGILQINDNKKLFETEHFPMQFLAYSLGHLGVYEHLKKSGLDFTMVCPADIPQGLKTGKYLVKANFFTNGWRINHADLAHFIISELNRNEFIGMRVSISNF